MKLKSELEHGKKPGELLLLSWKCLRRQLTFACCWSQMPLRTWLCMQRSSLGLGALSKLPLGRTGEHRSRAARWIRAETSWNRATGNRFLGTASQSANICDKCKPIPLDLVDLPFRIKFNESCSCRWWNRSFVHEASCTTSRPREVSLSKLKCLQVGP